MNEEGPSFDRPTISVILAQSFAAPLIISTIGLMMYGINCSQIRSYLHLSAKEDPLLTRIWVSIVMSMNTAAAVYTIYYNWWFSIEWFTREVTEKTGPINGNVVILYSVVVMSVQLFWLVCLDAMAEPRSRRSIFVGLVIGFGTTTSFCLAIVVAVLSNNIVKPDGSWPSRKISKFLQSVIALDLGVDLLILAAMLTQFRRMRRDFASHRKTFSRLSYTLCGVAVFSNLIMIAELIINLPRKQGGPSWIPFTITFAPVISPLYTFGMLSVLNARDDEITDKFDLSQEDDEGQRRSPQLTFTNQLYSLIAERNARTASLRSRAASEPTGVVGEEEQEKEIQMRERRETQSHWDELRIQRRISVETGSETQSCELGIQTI